MATVFVESNLPVVIEGLQEKIDRLSDQSFIPRAVAFGLIDQVTQRIHDRSIGSDGQPLGDYNKEYLKRRQRPPYNRTGDPAVRVSLTRQLENDWGVMETSQGWGIGFKNPFNKEKAAFVEQVRKRKIFELTQEEVRYVEETVAELIADVFK